MSFARRGLTPLVAALGAFLLSAPVEAGELDNCLDQALLAVQADAGTPALLDVEQVELGLPKINLRQQIDLDAVPMRDLSQVVDYHPETDRWTDRNNRIRVAPWFGAWFYSGELDVKASGVVGFRLAWEVPGFIGIRWDSGFSVGGSRGAARMEIKGATIANPNSSRHMDGLAHSHGISLAIFNPELSTVGLAFWAGFGAGVWVFNFAEDDVFGADSNIDASADETNIAGNIFFEIDYKIADIFHIGLGVRQHFLLADHTDDGRFYELNGVDQSFGSGRNDGIIDDLAGVTEITINMSFLF